MCQDKNHSRKKNYLSQILKFTYPKLHQGKSWYVDFTSYDPAENRMKRKKIMLDSIPSIRDRKRRATEIIESTLTLLRSGWSPWVNVDSNRGYTSFESCLNLYGEYVERQIRYKTRKSYSSRLNILREYQAQRLLPIKYIYQFDSIFSSDFLDWIFLDRECSPRTRNNYRGWCSSLAGFFVEKKYLASNPVESIKPLAEGIKFREALTATQLTYLSDYLSHHDKHFLLACKMEYYTFIRPEELSNIKVGDINIAEQKIFISAAFSKNKRDGNVGINSDIIHLMLDLEIFSYPNNHYIFGVNFRPSEKKGSSEMFRRRWNKLRTPLELDKCHQFYSLKDSGIRDLANSAGIVIARDQARHTDISTTNKYLQGRDSAVHSATKTFKGNL